MSEREWLHTYSWAGYFAHPVEVLSRGAKYCRVKLMHRTHIGKTTYEAGTIKHRVPNESVTEYPSRVAFVSQGGGRFK